MREGVYPLNWAAKELFRLLLNDYTPKVRVTARWAGAESTIWSPPMGVEQDAHAVVVCVPWLPDGTTIEKWRTESRQWLEAGLRRSGKNAKRRRVLDGLCDYCGRPNPERGHQCAGCGAWRYDLRVPA